MRFIHESNCSMTACCLAALAVLVPGCRPEEAPVGPVVDCEPSDTISAACGAIRRDLVNKDFSIGIGNNSTRAPNSAAVVSLNFNERDTTLGRTLSVVALAVPDGGIDIDGSDDEWGAVPTETFSMRPAHELLPPEVIEVGYQETINHGIYAVEVSAAYDSDHIYMKLRWRDTTRNDVAERWTWTNGAWRRYQGARMIDVDPSLDHPLVRGLPLDSGEDGLFIMFNKTMPDFVERKGCAGLCHIQEGAWQTIGGIEYYIWGGSMTTATLDERTDSWMWRATRTNKVGLADDGYFDCGSDGVGPCDPLTRAWRHGDAAEASTYVLPREPGEAPCIDSHAQAEVDPARLGDPEAALGFYVGNWWLEADNDGRCVSRGPSRMPASGPGSRFFSELEAVMLAGDEAFDEGATLPGMIHLDLATVGEPGACARCDVAAVGRWDKGYWTVELGRRLVAPQLEFDVDFTLDELP
jgi:hypothetical protein